MSADEPVTAVISRRVRPGRRADYERWVHEVTATLQRFPGQQGLSVLQPDGAGSDLSVIVLRFASYDDLRRWQTSAERRTHLDALTDVAVEERGWQEQTGLETWFTVPGRAVSGPPARWKMAILTTLALYPLLVATDFAVGGILEPLPFALRSALTTPVLVAIMTWGLMPAVTRATYRWLYPQQPRGGTAR